MGLDAKETEAAKVAGVNRIHIEVECLLAAQVYWRSANVLMDSSYSETMTGKVPMPAILAGQRGADGLCSEHPNQEQTCDHHDRERRAMNRKGRLLRAARTKHVQHIAERGEGLYEERDAECVRVCRDD